MHRPVSHVGDWRKEECEMRKKKRQSITSPGRQFRVIGRSSLKEDKETFHHMMVRTRVVLPWSTWAITAMLRSFSVATISEETEGSATGVENRADEEMPKEDFAWLGAKAAAGTVANANAESIRNFIMINYFDQCEFPARRTKSVLSKTLKGGETKEQISSLVVRQSSSAKLRFPCSTSMNDG
jgi:hypothetical protein